MADLARQWRKASRHGGSVVGLPLPAIARRRLHLDAAACPDEAVSGRSFADWLAGA